MHGVNDVRQTEIHTAEPLVPEPSSSEVQIAIEMPKRFKSPGTDQILAELIQTGGKTFRYERHDLLTLWSRSSSEWYLRIQSLPQRKHNSSPVQRSTG
jgi:hypothetical protein